MQPDRTYLVPAFVRFGTSSRAAMTHDYMHFDVHGLLPGWLKRVFTTPLLLPNDDVVDGLVSLWQADLARGAATTLGGFSRALALAHAAFAQALEGVSVSRREELQRWLVSEPDLLPALELIERRLARPPQNDELAALCHMGVRHFVRRFKVSTGLTPVQFGLERRILEAASWLSQSDRTIEDIATTTGFTDRFYFSKMFKARLGSSPARYRMEHRRERGD